MPDRSLSRRELNAAGAPGATRRGSRPQRCHPAARRHDRARSRAVHDPRSHPSRSRRGPVAERPRGRDPSGADPQDLRWQGRRCRAEPGRRAPRRPVARASAQRRGLHRSGREEPARGGVSRALLRLWHRPSRGQPAGRHRRWMARGRLPVAARTPGRRGRRLQLPRNQAASSNATTSASSSWPWRTGGFAASPGDRSPRPKPAWPPSSVWLLMSDQREDLRLARQPLGVKRSSSSSRVVAHCSTDQPGKRRRVASRRRPPAGTSGRTPRRGSPPPLPLSRRRRWARAGASPRRSGRPGPSQPAARPVRRVPDSGPSMRGRSALRSFGQRGPPA